jgi:flagellar biosynthetic protein FliP
MTLLPSRKRWLAAVLLLASIVLLSLVHGSAAAQAAPTPSSSPAASVSRAPAVTATRPAGIVAPTGPAVPTAPTGADGPNSGSIDVNIGGKPSTSISIMLLLTVVSVAPSLLLLMTSFTKIFVVLSIARNALGLTTVPPNQVLAGLSLFVSAFIMGPIFSKVNTQGISPYLDGTKTRQAAFTDGIAPLHDFMLAHTRPQEIALMLRAGQLPNPTSTDKVGLTTLIPAFVLSELRSAMIIGFVIYIPFLIIDMVVSSSLMSLGMMMLPPVTVSLPFKLLLFVLVDGWGLVINALVASYRT